MNPEEALLATILDDPDADTARLVFADWLEEHGDARAATFRNLPEVCRFLAGLRYAFDAGASLRQLQEWVFGGRADVIRGLRQVLGLPPAPPRTGLRLPGLVEGVLEPVRQALSLAVFPGGAVDIIQGLADSRPKPEEVPGLATRLAAGASPGALLAVLERFGQDEGLLELLACLVQEMVLRGNVVGDAPAVARLASRLQKRCHPLARLPLDLTAVEGDLREWVPHYSPRNGSSWLSTSRLPGSLQDQLQRKPAPARAGLQETTDPATAARVATAVRDWEKRSNGQWEARLFGARCRIDESDLSIGLLGSLGLGCLAGAEEPDVDARRVTAHEAFATLFSAAANGGAYGPGRQGAYGRLDAWASLAGLVGADTDDVETVAGLASRCLWVSFEAASEWFYDVAWDVGLLVVRPDGRSLAVLAATDTD
jgi:uncharacterized protein (TIGR02996 family)